MANLLAATKTVDERLAALRAEPDQQVRKQFVATTAKGSVDAEARTVRFCITTGSVDRDNDTINPKGWDVSDFLRNPVVLWSHDYSQLPVARALDVTATGNGLESTAQFPPKGVHAFADTVFELLAGGFLNATSVGFRPLEAERAPDRDGIDFQRQSLLEWSIVPVPANADALMVARGKGVDMAPLEGWARGVLKGLKADGETCNACGGEMADGTCSGCGWRSPAAEPVTVPIVVGARPAVVKDATAAVAGSDDDPIRWNRQLSKAFDVASEPLEPSRLEIAWVSRYLETPVQMLSVESFSVPSARIGSFLASFEECLGAWTVDALRNMTESGREVPPEHESIQLNSTTTRSFMVEGLRFMRRADGLKMVGKLARTWYGLNVTHYIRHEQSAVRTAWVERVQHRAGELNYLRGEAFTLSGEFLDRGELDWPALFLEPEKEAVLRRTVDRINQDGEHMESRGLMLMGPPGTGKTLSGRVMMRQADTTFIWISARDFYRSGAFGAFTYAFDLAAECAPTILFFEDVDNWLGASEVDLLKTEMDGLKRRRGVETILTTNFPELIPDALIDRPGRFHDLLELALPTEGVRARMLSAWMPDAQAAEIAVAASETDGFSGAHLRELTNFARTIAAEESLATGPALERALAKLREQRELVASLRHAPDYRPSRVVRSLVGASMSAVAKRGRVLSMANESRLRTARDGIGTAIEQMDAVLSQLAQLPETDPAQLPVVDETAGTTTELAIRFADDPSETVALMLLDETEQTATAEDVRQALRGALAETIGHLVREQTPVALARARGRVD